MKTMKKLLSLCLALCLVLGLATPAFAAQGDSEMEPFNVYNPMMVPYMVTVAAESAQYYQFAGMMAGMSITVTGEGAYLIVNGMPYYDTENAGSVTAELTPSPMYMGDCMVAFGNSGTAEATFNVSLVAAPAPVGTQENPAEMVIGENAADLEENSWGYYYTWTAEEYGELTVSMTSEGWEYSVNNDTAGEYGDLHSSADEEPISGETIFVFPGDVITVVVNTEAENWQYPAGTVSFTAAFVAVEKPEYLISDKALVVGENSYLATERAADTTIFEFTPEEAGIYKISAVPSWSEDPVVCAQWNGTAFFPIAPTGELTDSFNATVTSVGQSVLVGISGAGFVNVTIEKTGEYVAPTTTVVVYENPETPEVYTLGDYEVLAKIDETTDKAVLGTDGYYHLNDAEGPVLVIDFVSGGVNMVDASGYGGLTSTAENADGNFTKTDYTDAFAEYFECAATANKVVSNVKVYPATEALVAMIEDVAQAHGWYEFAQVNGWLGMCKAVQAPTQISGGEFPYTTAKLAAGETVYFEVYRVSGSNLVIKDENAVVTIDGTKYTASNGAVTAELNAASPFVPVYVGLTNNGTAEESYVMELAYPEGTINNPAELKIGENVASIEAGNSEGYWLSYIAPVDGVLTITMNTEKNWFYSVQNITAGTYGENHTSGDDTVVASEKLEVKQGDEIRVAVNTFDESNQNQLLAGEIKITAAFAEGHICYMDKFTDVDASRYYHAGVDYVVDKGLMNGTSATTFGPTVETNRAMLVTILYRLEGEPSVEGIENPFTDVPANKYYTNAVIWAASTGIVNGITPTTFEPTSSLTREQLVTMLWRYADKPQADAAAMNEFTDVATVAKFAKEAMAWAIDEGIITGMTATTIGPKGSAVRGQLATILVRFLEQ